MASLEQLKKRLRSVKLAGKLAGAMKTASSAKHAKINRMFVGYRAYIEELEKLSGGTVTKTAEDTEADLYVIFGHSRGLCGGYHTELHSFADKVLEGCDKPVLVSGKYTAAHFPNAPAFLLPDTPTLDDCRPLFDAIIPYLTNGKKVALIHHAFINALIQRPTKKTLVPFALKHADDDMLLIPSCTAVLHELEIKIYETLLYKAALEAAFSAQSATLMAMRTAYDNAEETAAELQNEINKKRQGAVTASVLETSSAMASDLE